MDAPLTERRAAPAAQHNSQPEAPAAAGPLVLVVTGPSGAGRSTALGALEDLGFEAIDNLPAALVRPLLAMGPRARPLALGLQAQALGPGDGPGRGSDPWGPPEALAALDPAPRAEILYLDCRAEVLLRRYAETRRRHPMAPSEGPAIGIAREAACLGGLRERAHARIDTSEMTPHELRAAVARAYRAEAPEGADGLSVTLVSFAYRHGIPPGVDTAIDCRFLRNPHWEPRLRARWGTDAEVAAHIEADARHAPFLEAVLALLRVTIPAHRAEGRAHVTIGVGCTGGQHRSVAVAEALARSLAADGLRVSKWHRELERRAAADAPATTAPGAAPGAAPGPGRADEGMAMGAEPLGAGSGQSGAGQSGDRGA